MHAAEKHASRRRFSLTTCLRTGMLDRILALRRRFENSPDQKDTSVPSSCDYRSWHLLAEDHLSGGPIWAIRVTPRTEGPLEIERTFKLPPTFRRRSTIEIRLYELTTIGEDRLGLADFVVPQLRTFASQVGARRLVLCSTAEHELVRRWDTLQPTGLRIRDGSTFSEYSELFVDFETKDDYRWLSQTGPSISGVRPERQIEDALRANPWRTKGMMAGGIAAYARFVIRHRWGVLAGVLLLSLLFARAATHLHVEIDPDRQLPPDHPFIHTLNDVHRLFGDKNLVVVGRSLTMATSSRQPSSQSWSL